jgi:hypothetical protein
MSGLTFVQKVFGFDGNKRHTLHEVTHDESTTTIDASDLGMSYIDYALVTPVTLTDTITGDKMHMLSDGGPGKTVTLANALSVGDLFALEAWGG